MMRLPPPAFLTVFPTNTPTHYLRFISTSTKVFSYFKCDEFADTGERYLEKDYGLDCDGDRYKLFTGFGLIMIGVYPIGKFSDLTRSPLTYHTYSPLTYHHSPTTRPSLTQVFLASTSSSRSLTAASFRSRSVRVLTPKKRPSRTSPSSSRTTSQSSGEPRYSYT